MFQKEKATSDIWNHCKIKESNVTKLICNYCKKELSRGGQGVRTYTTSNMLKHLRTFHVRELEKYHSELEDDPSPTHHDDLGIQIGKQNVTDPEQPGTSNSRATPQSLNLPLTSGPASSQKALKKRPFVQSTVTSLFAKKEAFTKDHPTARKITDLVGEMVCLDNQPYSIVEDKGFNRLISFLEPRYQMPSRKYFSKKLIPDLYLKVRNECEKRLESVKWVSFTTDMWSSHANDDFLSLTAHYLNSKFELHHIFLEVIPFIHETHTAANISDFLKETLEGWHLTDKVNVFVRDSGRNFVAAMDHAEFKHVSCLAHTLQLVIKDGCLGNKTITNITANCRRLVGYFKHSCHANKILREAQTNLGMSKKKLKQDEPTRWDSTYDMLKRLQEQRAPISLASAKLKLPVELTSVQWQQIDTIVSILEIFKKATKTISLANILISEAIPIVNSLKFDIQSVEVERPGFQAIRNDLMASLQTRFRDMETEPIYSIATLMDPRLKDKIFSRLHHTNIAKDSLVTKLLAMSTENEDLPRPATTINVGASTFAAVTNTTTVVAPMWARYKESKIVALVSNNDVSEEKLIRDELEEYLREPLLEDSGNILHYWETSRFTRMKKLVPKYLGTPLSTLFSERLFSTAGLICNGRRSSMKPENLQKLVFLNKNL